MGHGICTTPLIKAAGVGTVSVLTRLFDTLVVNVEEVGG
jgi:hypothetical protein